MPKGMTPIYTQTVTSGTPITINFNNIPQTYTDLKVVGSIRSNQTGQTFRFISFFLNNTQGTAYSTTRLNGNGTSVGTSSQVNDPLIYINNVLPASLATANTFGNLEINIPNYSSTLFKQILIDGVSENNATASYQELQAGLYRSNTPVTSIHLEIGEYGNSYAIGSTYTLYGISR
jgi:hypothetical protein